MFKKIFSVTAVLLAVVCMNLSAQQLQSVRFNTLRPMFSNGTVTSQLPLNDGEYWWGYFEGDYGTTSLIGMGANSKIPQAYNAATCIPAGTEGMEGKNIEGISFSFPSAKNIKDVKVWISQTLPASVDEATECVQAVENVVGLKSGDDAVNEVRFAKPYKIDNTKDVYVGYYFVINKNEGKDDQYPVFTTGTDGHEKGLLVKTGEDGEWMDYNQYGFGDLAARILIGGGVYEDNMVSIPESCGSITGVKNSVLRIPVEVKNLGGNGFTSLGLTVDVAGSRQEITVTPESKVSGIYTKYNFDLDVMLADVLGEQPITITIDKVNGADNTCKDKTMTGKLFVVTRMVDRKVLFEEFTATWCGFCPRGAVGMEKAKQVYGDKVVLIAVHYQDEMSCNAYFNLIKKTVEGFPGGHISRTYMGVDPYFGLTGNKMFGVSELIDACLEEVPSIEVKAEGVLDGDILTAKSDVKFLYDGKANCAVAYVVTEDGMENESWWQGNNYSGARGFDEEPLFDKWVNADKKAKGVVYNEVAIAAEGVEKGIDGSLPTDVVAEASNNHEIKIDLTQYPVIMDKTKLNLCVFVIDRNTGHVVNADCKPVVASTGIEDIQAEDGTNTEVARYTMDGRRISLPEKGVNIVKYSDGQVKKVVVR